MSHQQGRDEEKELIGLRTILHCKCTHKVHTQKNIQTHIEKHNHKHIRRKTHTKTLSDTGKIIKHTAPQSLKHIPTNTHAQIGRECTDRNIQNDTNTLKETRAHTHKEKHAKRMCTCRKEHTHRHTHTDIYTPL